MGSTGQLTTALEKPLREAAFSRARQFIAMVRGDGDEPLFQEILDIYRMALSSGGNIFFRCRIIESEPSSACIRLN